MMKFPNKSISAESIHIVNTLAETSYSKFISVILSLLYLCCMLLLCYYVISCYYLFSFIFLFPFIIILSITSLCYFKYKIQNLLKFVKADINQVRGDTDSAFLARSIANN